MTEREELLETALARARERLFKTAHRLRHPPQREHLDRWFANLSAECADAAKLIDDTVKGTKVKNWKVVALGEKARADRLQEELRKLTSPFGRGP